MLLKYKVTSEDCTKVFELFKRYLTHDIYLDRYVNLYNLQDIEKELLSIEKDSSQRNFLLKLKNEGAKKSASGMLDTKTLESMLLKFSKF